jgi:diacylglycerol kinase (ATP)
MHDSKNRPFLSRLSFACAGLVHGMQAEKSFRFQVAIFIAVFIALMILRPEPLWWGLVLMTSFLVLAAELFNTALEHLVDHLHPQVHPQIRVVKDCAAGAVLLTVCGAIAVGIAFVLHLAARGG